jgi:hypothetical protein
MTDMGEAAACMLVDSHRMATLVAEGPLGVRTSFVERVLHIHVADTTDSQLHR